MKKPRILKYGFLLAITYIIVSCSSQKTIDWGCVPSILDFPMDIKISELYYFSEKDSIVIQGEIIDSLTNEPLIGANVQILSSDKLERFGSATDIEGMFTLCFNYKSHYKIKFAYIGYLSEEYELNIFIQKIFEQSENDYPEEIN